MHFIFLQIFCKISFSEILRDINITANLLRIFIISPKKKLNMKKVILVTGANRGIGKEICKQLAVLDHDVILTARDERKAKESGEAIGLNCSPVQLDVSDERSVKKASRWVQEHYGRLDVLINNAGIIAEKSLVESDIDEIQKIMDVNFYGPIRMNKYFLPLLRESAEARIINMSSGMGAYSNMKTAYAGYRLSKAGMNAQTILLSKELVDSNISVNAMSPGWVKTDMGGQEAPRTVEQGADTAVWLATADGIPSGGFYRDREIIEW